MHLWPHDYFADRPCTKRGLSRLAAEIGRIRSEAPDALLVDNGDTLQGTPMGDLAAEPGWLEAHGPHPAVAAMNALGYDAAALGNHDLDYGAEFARAAFHAARFPVLCANLRPEGRTVPAWPGATILHRTIRDGTGRPHPLAIGLFGVLPPQTAIWNQRQLRGRWEVADIVETARTETAGLRAAGAEIVVALAHSGLEPGAALHGMENAAAHVAALPGIDAVVAGHLHAVFPDGGACPEPGWDGVRGTVAGTPVTMPGHGGSHLGVIALRLVRRDARWRAIAGAAALRRPALGGDASAIRAACEHAHRATLEAIRKPVARLGRPLSTRFALAADCAALQLTAEAQRDHAARALAGGPHADLPLLSAVPPFRAGGLAGPGNYTDIAAGPLLRRHLADLLPYPNELRAVLVDGETLGEWLEMAASVFRQVAPGATDAELVDPGFPAFNFDVVKGLRYLIDLGSPPRYRADGGRVSDGRRILGLTHLGHPVGTRDRFVVVTNDYRAAGGGNFPLRERWQVVLADGARLLDVLAAHVSRSGEVAPRPEGSWRFRPMPGTTTTIDSASGEGAEPPPATPRIEPVGPAPGGFRRYRLHL